MERKPLSYAGDVHSMKCALAFVNPNSKQEATKDVAWLQYSLEHEQGHQNRTTVTRMIEARMRKIKKQFGLT